MTIVVMYSTVSFRKERPMHLNLSISLALHRTTLAFMCEFSHLLSNVLQPNNPTLSGLQPSGMTSSQSGQTTCSSAVAARTSSILLSIWSSSSELAIACVETQCCLRRRQREAKTTEQDKFQCNAIRICCSKDEWKILESKKEQQ